MFRKLFILGLLTVCAIPVNCQSVIITGSVLGVSAQERTWEETKLEHVFVIRLYLQLRNPYDYPVIVLKPNSYFLDRKVEFFDSYSGAPVDAFTAKFENSAPGGIFGGFSDAEPSKSLFVVIPAHGYYEFGDQFITDSGYSTTEEVMKNARGEPFKDNRGKALIRYSSPQSTRPFLHIEYHGSFKTEKNISERLDAARKRWSRFGKLLISPEGDFTITSDMIVNTSSN